MNPNIEADDIVFYRSFALVMRGFVILVFFYLSLLVGTVLISAPEYMRDWRGVTCIALSIIAFCMYAIPCLFNGQHWPPLLRYALPMWGGMYLSVFLLTLIDRSFIWDFYLVFGLVFGLFASRYVLFMVSVVALTIFSFQGLMIWPLSSGDMLALAGQAMTMYSLTGLCLLFQRLIGERFVRNGLLKELKDANTQLEDAHRRLEQSMAQEQELAVLRERTRLAREMHDTLGHALVLIAVKLEAAQRLRERDPVRCDQELEATKAIARESMASLRASIADLRSPVLERERIQQALERLARDLTRRTALRVTCDLQVDVACLSAPLEEVLWKVSQEALANIEKHAHATKVKLGLSQQEDQLMLRIQDDGIGLPTTYYQYREDGSFVCLSPDGHFGLRGMLERVEHADGHLQVRSASGEGTTIEVTLPIRGIHEQLDNKKAQRTGS